MIPSATLLSFVILLSFVMPSAAQSMDISHYIESVQVVLYDDIDTGTTTIVHMTSNIDDTIISNTLERDLWDHPRVLGVLFTNADGCVPGVVDEACLIVNVARIPEETDIGMVQNGTRLVGDQFISRLNSALGLTADFHSVFVHFNDEQHTALSVPGKAMTYNTVSVVYTIQNDTTLSLYEKFLNTVFPQDIAQGGGFVDAAKILATDENSFLLFVMDVESAGPITQLRVTKSYVDTLTDDIDPLERLGVDTIHRSSYFDDGFYPLSSLVRVAISSSSAPSISDVTTTLPGMDGRPDDVTDRGWFFDPDSGSLIRGTFLLGELDSVSVGETRITLDMSPSNTTKPVPDDMTQTDDTTSDAAPMEPTPYDVTDSLVVVIIVVIAGGAAAAFYLKGYRR